VRERVITPSYFVYTLTEHSPETRTQRQYFVQKPIIELY